MTHAEKEIRNLEIVELRKQGYSQNQIAEMYGLNQKTISGICIRHGVYGVMSDKKGINQHKKQTYEEEKQYVESLLPVGFSYVGGYIDCEHKVTIRCDTCGYEFERSMVSIRHNQVPKCPSCQELQLKKKQEGAERERQQKAIDRQKKKEAQQAEKDLAAFINTRLVECAECGKVFSTRDSKRVCCSSECSRHRANHRSDRRITKDKRIDKNITARSLYKRDGGICWICGGKCNLEDYITRDGTIICGDYYPSVDHIVPVCEGGEDAWSNVRLAHRKCNLDRYISGFTPLGQKKVTSRG